MYKQGDYTKLQRNETEDWRRVLQRMTQRTRLRGITRKTEEIMDIQ